MRNLKQETLAEAAGVSQNTIHKLTGQGPEHPQADRDRGGRFRRSGLADRRRHSSRAQCRVRGRWQPIGAGTAASVDSDTPLDEDEVELPLYKEVEMSAGAGRTAVREIEGRKLRFPMPRCVPRASIRRRRSAPNSPATAWNR